MDTINELRKLMDGSQKKENNPAQEKEERFIHAAAACLNEALSKARL